MKDRKFEKELFYRLWRAEELCASTNSVKEANVIKKLAIISPFLAKPMYYTPSWCQRTFWSLRVALHKSVKASEYGLQIAAWDKIYADAFKARGFRDLPWFKRPKEEPNPDYCESCGAIGGHEPTCGAVNSKAVSA